MTRLFFVALIAVSATAVVQAQGKGRRETEREGSPKERAAWAKEVNSHLMDPQGKVRMDLWAKVIDQVMKMERTNTLLPAQGNNGKVRPRPPQMGSTWFNLGPKPIKNVFSDITTGAV